MAIQDDNTILNKGDLKAYHQKILPYLGGNMMVSTNNSDYYSTDEKVVGVWTDGKPIYQKTIEVPITVADGANFNFVNHNISGITAETVRHIDIIGHRSANTWAYPLGSSPSGDWHATVGAEKVGVFTTDTQAINTSAYVTFRYTKTTDAAGSATTTPGAYDINFPNTWKENTEIYFGNGLYGQHLTGSLSMTSSPSIQRLSSIWGTNYQLVASGGTIKRGSNNTIVSLNSSSSSIFNGLYLVTTDMSASLTTGVYLEAQENGSMTNTYNIWITYCK